MRTTIFLALSLTAFALPMTASAVQAAELRTVTVADLPKTLAEIAELGQTVISVLPLAYKVETTCEPQPAPGCYPVDPEKPDSPVYCVDPFFTPADQACETMQVLEAVTIVSQ